MSKKESLYKILGTNANIGNARIKEKYIQALKAHPPETDPDGFEKVRHAYETLKDPEKRKQYDLSRKYGADVEELLQKAQLAFQSGNLRQADNLFNKAAKISPEDTNVITGMMMLAIAREEFDKMEEYFQHVISVIPESQQQERSGMYSMRASVLLRNEYYEESLDALEEWQGTDVMDEEDKFIETMKSTVYRFLERTEEAWKAINRAITLINKNGEFDDIHLFLTLSEVMMESEKWGEKAKVQSRFRNFIKHLSTEEEMDEAFELLDDAVMDAEDEGEYQKALFYIDIQVVLDSSDQVLKNKRKELHQLARVQKDIKRLTEDEDAFPLIVIRSIEWFFDDIMPADELEEQIQEMLPSGARYELEQEKEYYAAGILRLRKKYASLYKHFKGKWDQLFEALTEGFNREMKRELKRMK